MNTVNKKKITVALILNLLIIVLEIIGFVISYNEMHFSFFRYYTQDSNLIGLLAATAMAVFQLLCLIGKKEAVAKWAVLFKYISVCLMSVTFLVVIFVLSPMNGGINGYVAMLFRGAMLYHHLLCPVLAFISFMFFDDIKSAGIEKIGKKAILTALIPTLIYAAITLTLNIMRVMEGPYPFLMVYKQSPFMSVVWCVLILGGALGIAFLTAFIKNKRESAVKK